MFDAVKISLIAFIFIILGEPGMIFAPYQKLLNHLPEWLSKPLGQCLICFTGQLSFWYYILFKEYNILDHLDTLFIDSLITYFKDYNLIEHLFFVSLSIYLTKLFSFIWTSLER